MQPAIRTDNLGKRYRLRHEGRRGYRTLRESLSELAGAPFRAWHRGGPTGAEDFWALQGVSFAVQPGEVIGVIGRNGAGKSTLLKILSRITKPSTGQAVLRGRVASLLEVGTGFHPELTGRENVYLSGSILGMSRREIRSQFDEIAAFAEVDRFLDTPVKRYSSGMYVRLAFAVAAHLQPEILLVDEVLAVGDAAFQKKCLGKMTDVARGGKTVLFVSHNMSAVQQLCPHCFLFEAGRLALSGATEQVVAGYLRDASSAADGCFDLSEHPSRARGHRSILRKLILRGGSGHATTTFHPEDAFEVELVLEAAAPIRAPRVAVAVEDALGRRITTAASYFHDQPLAEIEGRCRVRCRLERLGLGSGRYLVSVSIGDRYTGLLDSLDCAAWFEVVWNNNYGNGEPYHPVYGPVLTPSTWEQCSGGNSGGTGNS